MRCLYVLPMFALAGSALLLGCNNSDKSKPKSDQHANQEAKRDVDQKGQSDEIKAARAKLNPEDRKLVDAQEFCAVTADSRLGEMGTPIKIMVTDQPVFLCCKGCQRKALADPDTTLATVEELKAKVKADAKKK